ncbi:uncharacterized protein PV09_08606 [Verruconis gallopava]|uniref:Uncharacterized protein n=1 Tax=Verruconis gallopava TaxID=253628 RepID=A0A0D1ZZD3_9PEZI|nr:uncharacterized protein PV09_08606 [Verruconis gallopava]KIV99802.1 hypothetical protein PV09_08606 [Verruconis gallopava]
MKCPGTLHGAPLASLRTQDVVSFARLTRASVAREALFQVFSVNDCAMFSPIEQARSLTRDNLGRSSRRKQAFGHGLSPHKAFALFAFHRALGVCLEFKPRIRSDPASGSSIRAQPCENVGTYWFGTVAVMP